MRGYLTTTQLADLAGVTQSTILDAIQKKESVRAIRTPGGHYRISNDEAVRFLKNLGIDPGRLARKTLRILSVTNNEQTQHLVQEALLTIPHVLERSEDALATWRKMVEGESRTTRNLVRLAEVMAGFGYREQALPVLDEACKMDPEFADRINYAQLLREEEQYDASLKQIQLALDLSESSEEKELVLQERIKTYQTSGKLGEQITLLQQQLEDNKAATAARWQQLAL